MVFTPGTPKPANSGSKTGQKYKKTIDRENAVRQRRETLITLCQETDGMTAEEIISFMNYNPLIHAITIATDPTTPVNVAQKANESIMKKVYPDLKTVENKGDQVNTIRILMPGMPGYDEIEVSDQSLDIIPHHDTMAMERVEQIIISDDEADS